MQEPTRLRELMAQHNIRSVRALGRQVGISECLLRYLLDGRQLPSRRTVHLFSKAFPHVNEEWLFPNLTNIGPHLERQYIRKGA